MKKNYEFLVGTCASCPIGRYAFQAGVFQKGLTEGKFLEISNTNVTVFFQISLLSEALTQQSVDKTLQLNLES